MANWASGFIKRNGKALVKGIVVAGLAIGTGGAAIPVALAAGAAAAAKRDANHGVAPVATTPVAVAPTPAQLQEAGNEARVAAGNGSPAVGVPASGFGGKQWAIIGGIAGAVLLVVVVVMVSFRRSSS